MAEQLLDDAQVGAALEQVRRERVAQRVRADTFGEAGGGGRPLDRGPGLLARQPAAAVAQEQRTAADRVDVSAREQAGRAAGHPAPEPVERDVADRDEPLLVALADDADEAAVDRQVLAVEPDRLADPQPRRVQQLEQGAVAQGMAGVRAVGPSGSSPPAASSRRTVSSGVSVSGRRRDGRGRSRWAATSIGIRPSP